MNIFRNIKLVTGECLISKGGRELAPIPKIALDTTPKCNATLHRLFDWLLDEARNETRACYDDYALTLFSGMTVKTLSQADKHLLNEYLFGHPDGPTTANIRHLQAA